MAQDRLTREAVEQILEAFPDPESGRSVMRMEQVHALHLSDDQLSVTLGLTTYSAPLWKETRARLVELLRNRFPQLSEVTVQVEPHHRPAEKMGEVGLAAKTVLAVGSGKGGVGKSTVAAVLAFGLLRSGCKVGLMDADVYGPSIPHLLGSDARPEIAENKLRPVVVDGLKVMFDRLSCSARGGGDLAGADAAPRLDRLSFPNRMG